MMIRRTLALLSLLIATTALTQDFGGGIDAGPKVTIDGSVSKRSGDQVDGVVVAKIKEGWHINSAKPLDDFAIPTVLQIENAELVSAQYPQHELRSFAFSGGKPIAVYQGTIQIPFTAKLPAGATKLDAALRYQACNDNVCLPPKTAAGVIDATVVPGLTPAATTSNFTPLSAAPKNAKPSLGNDRLATTFESSGLPLTLGLIFLAGLALNLTPCVFPLIPITVGFFALQSDGRRSRRFALSAMYVLGIVITYSTLGVIAALSGKLFGAWLQLPVVQIGLAVLMLVMASSMFGAFEIQVPRWIANQSHGRAGLVGAMTMGLVVGIVAAPCVGPFVISLIALVAAIGKPLLGFVMFAALAFGLGFPYLVALNALPRPGEWMVQVKRAMGFVLIAMAFYFLRPRLGEEVFRWGVAGSLLIGAVFLFLVGSRAGRQIRVACASILLIAGIAFAIPRNSASGPTWENYDAAKIARAKKPVVIDFYATWCLPCKELDEKTFPDKRVASELGRFVRVKADLTAPEDPQTKALTRQYAILGVPTIVFLDANGQELRELRLTGYEAPEKFVDRLRRAR